MDEETKKTIKTLSNLLVIFAILFTLYLCFVSFWRITSDEYPPEGLVDHVVRDAPPVEDWFLHRNDHDGSD